MKKILFVFILLFATFSFAQMDRRIGRVPGGGAGSQQKNEKIDPMAASLAYLKKELNLDTFQEAATKTFLEENQKEKDYIMTLDISDDAKVVKMKVSYEKMDDQIRTLLSAKQKEAFAKLIAKTRGTDKKKKNKKEEKKEENSTLEN